VLKLAKKFMKKIMMLSFSLLGAVFLAGCGQQPIKQIKPTASVPVIQKQEVNKQTEEINKQITVKPVDEAILQQTYSNPKFGFEINYPTDWDYVVQNNSTDIFNEFLFPKKGNESVVMAANPALEMGKVPEYLELNSVIMGVENYKDFDLKKYVAKGFGKYEEELVNWEEKVTTQGRPVYFYTVKVKSTSLDEVKEGAIFLNDKEKKVTFLERSYRMNGSKISDDLRKSLREIALSFVDTQK